MAQSADALNAKSVGALKIHGALGCVTCLSGALGRDRSVGPAAGEGAMTDFEDNELAQAIHRELLELRARANAVTPVELSVLAAKAELPANWQPDETKGAIDDARTDALPFGTLLSIAFRRGWRNFGLASDLLYRGRGRGALIGVFQNGAFNGWPF